MILMHLGWLQTGLLLLSPAIALAIALFFGRYPGEKLLFRESPPPRRERRRGGALRIRVAPVRRIGGGLLLGRSLAGRAPPGDLSCHIC
jgi:hypothetical protein